ncbi:MAG: hypothetical protein IJ948_03085 [Clostridia bacterium]|nr:hypothetical protein [Clostridia bacterium]
MAQVRKNILIFCPAFFGYQNRIAQAFKDEGYSVDLYDERPNNGFVCKTLLRLNFKPYKSVVQKYIKKVIEQNRDKQYDYVLVVKSEAFGEKELELLRNAYTNAEFILYLWDSVVNVPDGEKKISLYDKVFTFDPNDAEKYNIPFLPIPYGKEYSEVKQSGSYEYDVAFIGTAHSVRPRVIKTIKKQCDEMGKKCFYYFYSPHILVYLLNKLINKDYKYISLKEVNFKGLTSKEVCEVYASSRCVLDIEHPKQKGTTTRPVEMLPMKKKIITTNTHVKDFDFYSENNFLIIDRDNPQINEEFFESPYIEASKEVVEKYSPKTFVRKCFGEE